jgi:anti-sigma factor (TIGR02949 family)
MTFFGRLKAFFGGASSNGEDSGQGMISCHDALTLVQEFLDGELGDVSRDQVEAHFEACERCYPHLRLEQAFREAVGRAATGESAPPELRSAVMKALAKESSEGGLAEDPGS